MGAFFTAILAKIVAFAGWLITLTLAMFAAWWLLGTDLGAWVVEQMLDIVILVFSTIDVDFELFNPGNYLSALPAEMLQIMRLLRLGECFAIILAAILARITLQLVPFTRLGS